MYLSKGIFELPLVYESKYFMFIFVCMQDFKSWGNLWSGFVHLHLDIFRIIIQDNCHNLKS